MHTHDPSGVVHVEVPNPNNVPITQSMTTLGQFLDIAMEIVGNTQASSKSHLTCIAADRATSRLTF